MINRIIFILVMGFWFIGVANGQSRSTPGGWVYMYPMDGHAGDAGVYRNHGILRGNTTATKDRFGRPNQALHFDGVNSYVEIPYAKAPDLAPEVFTFTAWVYIDQYYSGEAWDPVKTYQYAPIFSKTNGGDQFQYRFTFTDKGFYFDGGKEKQSRGVFYSSGITVPLQKWTFITITCNGYTLKVFINDRLATSVSGSYSYPSNGQALMLGVDFAGSDDYFKGSIDDFSIWEKYLTEDEIKSIYYTQLKRPIDMFIPNPTPVVETPIVKVPESIVVDTVVVVQPPVEVKDTTVVTTKPEAIDSTHEFIVKEGYTIVLRHVLFEQSRAVLLPESYEELDKLVTTLTRHPSMEILVSGHTDNQGNRDLNVKLSEERAERVKQYLVEKGINPNRIKCKGYGPDKPISPNFTEDQRRLNRRVEFMIVKM
jgi:outer membrane protein OmpA-like peptidoglycan-associated protein